MADTDKKSVENDESSESENEEKEGPQEGENKQDGEKKQLTKNQKRKAKKKRRAKEKKEDAKKRKVAVEFVYDPNAVESTPQPKEEPQPPPPPVEEKPPTPPPVEEPPPEPTPPPVPQYPRRRVKRSNDIDYVSEDLANSPHKELILQFRKPTTLDREHEVKQFYKIILDLMKKSDRKLTSQDIDEEEDEEKLVPGRMHQMETSCGKLFQLLEKKQLPKEILRKLLVIKRKLVMLEYNEAQVEYFNLTIGNAPWPTMLGSKSVLEDEEKRKTLQAIKRLMTFFQETMVPIRTMMYHPLP